MDDLLTPISTTYLKSKKEDEPFFTEVKPPRVVTKTAKPTRISSADDVVDLLRNQPGYDELVSALNFLTTPRGSNTFHLQAPGPKSAAIVHLLVTEIVPNYWTLLLEGSAEDDAGVGSSRPRDAELLIRCLRSVTGINAIVAHARALTREWNTGNKDSRRPDLSLNLGIFLDLLAALLEGNESVRTIWTASTTHLSDVALKKAQSQTLLSLITSGRIVSVAAEALGVVGREDVRPATRWITEGVQFSKWAARNVASWAKHSPEEVELQCCFEVFQRGMSLGYAGKLKYYSGHWSVTYKSQKASSRSSSTNSSFRKA